MKDKKLKPVIYEYRYNHLPDDIRHRVIENRHSLFDRSQRMLGKVKKSGDVDTLIAKLGVISGIALIGYIISLII